MKEIKMQGREGGEKNDTNGIRQIQFEMAQT